MFIALRSQLIIAPAERNNLWPIKWAPQCLISGVINVSSLRGEETVRNA